jgi:tetratricopeptide (TPR) repeat protein
MKKNYTTIYLFLLLMGFTVNSFGQLNTPRGSQMATVSQRVGITDITITYSRPSVNEREIWGKLVPYGMNNLGFGTAKESPWRAGANENTTISFTNDVNVEGKQLKAGTYGLHLIIHEDDKATVIFSNNSTAWGSFFYEPSEDALRVDVSTKEIPHKELLTFEFIEVNTNDATATLNWEKKQIPIKIEVAVTEIVLNDIRKKLQSQDGFNRQTWENAAAFSMNNGGDLNEAMEWIDKAIAGQFYSKQTFNNTQIKSGILNKIGKQQEALEIMESFLPQATIFEVHQYGRQLIGLGLKDEAMKVFEMNAKNNKNIWPVNYGMARAYSAKGDYKKALSYLKKAFENAPNEGSKGRVQANIEKLKNGQDIN